MNEKRIQQVLEIEKQSQEIQDKAKRAAQELPVAAEQEAQQLVAKARAAAEQEARQLVASAQAKGEADKILAEAEATNRQVEATARKNLDKAVAFVLERVVGGK
jgi:vacuolar-type H+-ATPase subunit H